MMTRLVHGIQLSEGGREACFLMHAASSQKRDRAVTHESILVSVQYPIVLANLQPFVFRGPSISVVNENQRPKRWWKKTTISRLTGFPFPAIIPHRLSRSQKRVTSVSCIHVFGVRSCATSTLSLSSAHYRA